MVRSFKNFFNIVRNFVMTISILFSKCWLYSMFGVYNPYIYIFNWQASLSTDIYWIGLAFCMQTMEQYSKVTRINKCLPDQLHLNILNWKSTNINETWFCLPNSAAEIHEIFMDFLKLLLSFLTCQINTQRQSIKILFCSAEKLFCSAIKIVLFH